MNLATSPPVRPIAASIAILVLVVSGHAAVGAPAGITVANAWFRYITPAVPAGGYMTLRDDSSRPATLTAATSSACGSLMLHRSESSSGSERMVPVASVTIQPGGSVTFAPGGYHLMCMAPRMSVGGTVPVTLRFQDGATLDTTFPVVGATGHAPGSAG